MSQPRQLPYPGVLDLARYFDWDENSEQVREISELCRKAYEAGLLSVSIQKSTVKDPGTEKTLEVTEYYHPLRES